MHEIPDDSVVDSLIRNSKASSLDFGGNVQAYDLEIETQRESHANWQASGVTLTVSRHESECMKSLALRMPAS